MRDLDLAWLVGFLEGEGTFSPHKQKVKNKGFVTVTFQPRVQVQSCDKDIVERAAELLGSKVLGPYNQNRSRGGFSKNGYKPCWVASVAGKKARDFLQQALPMFGKRRQQQIREALDAKNYRQYPDGRITLTRTWTRKNN